MNQSLGTLDVDLLPRHVPTIHAPRTFIWGLVLGAFLGIAAAGVGPWIATTLSAANAPAPVVSESSTDEYAASHSFAGAPVEAAPASGSSTDEYRAMYENRPATGPDTSRSGSSTDEYVAMYENR